MSSLFKSRDELVAFAEDLCGLLYVESNREPAQHCGISLNALNILLQELAVNFGANTTTSQFVSEFIVPFTGLHRKRRCVTKRHLDARDDSQPDGGPRAGSATWCTTSTLANQHTTSRMRGERPFRPCLSRSFITWRRRVRRISRARMMMMMMTINIYQPHTDLRCAPEQEQPPKQRRAEAEIDRTGRDVGGPTCVRLCGLHLSQSTSGAARVTEI